MRTDDRVDRPPVRRVGRARRDVLTSRGYVCDWERGARPLPVPGAALRLGRVFLTPLAAVGCALTDDPVVSLTYDDGPDPGSTPLVLDALAERGTPATFFVLVERAEAHPGLVREMQDAGHEVALHGIDHRRLSRLPARVAVRLIREGKTRLEEVTGREVRFFRPAYGAQGLGQMVGTAMAGLEVVLWSAWAKDWLDEEPVVTAARATAALHPGAVLLLHDARGDATGAREAVDVPPRRRAAVTRLVLDGMTSRGLSGLRLGDLLARHAAVRTVWFERSEVPE